MDTNTLPESTSNYHLKTIVVVWHSKQQAPTMITQDYPGEPWQMEGEEYEECPTFVGERETGREYLPIWGTEDMTVGASYIKGPLQITKKAE